MKSSRIKHLRVRLEDDDFSSLIRWAVQWVYWKSGAYRLYQLNRKTVGNPNSTSASLPPVCTDIKLWCEKNSGSEYEVLLEQRLVHHSLPQTLEAEVDPRFKRLENYEAPELGLVKISHATLIGQHGLILLPDGSFAGEANAPYRPIAQKRLELDRDYRNPPARVESKRGNYFSAAVFFAGNYFHWLRHVLLRLCLVLPLLPHDIKIIVPANARPSQIEQLFLLGVQEEQLRVFSNRTGWKAECLYFTSPGMDPMLDSREMLESIREKFMRALRIQRGKAERRIYISRRHTNRRRVVNEDEVQALLLKLGFESHTPELLSFRDQVDLFAHASLIVGPHGSAFTNCIFAPETARLLEFFEPQKVFDGFWTTATDIGQNYWYLMGNTVANPEGPQADIFVPLDKLEETLNAMLESSN